MWERQNRGSICAACTRAVWIFLDPICRSQPAVFLIRLFFNALCEKQQCVSSCTSTAHFTASSLACILSNAVEANVPCDHLRGCVHMALTRGRKPPVCTHIEAGREAVLETFSQFDEVVAPLVSYRWRPRSQVTWSISSAPLTCVHNAGHCCVAIDVHFHYDAALAILILNRSLLPFVKEKKKSPLFSLISTPTSQ